ncbi:MAG TPA: hypothetical protein DDY78_12360 [Planctomycetales bacterium]|nr:hypothetical protein [Planctomycetales bacterium]
MPLRDHFRPPLDDETQWEGFHGGWPMMIVAAVCCFRFPVISSPFLGHPSSLLGGPVFGVHYTFVVVVVYVGVRSADAVLRACDDIWGGPLSKNRD